MSRARAVVGALLVLAAGAASALAVRAAVPDAAVQELRPNTPYDGRFTFARLSYGSSMSGGFRRGRGGYGFDGCWGGEPAWLHDYPCAEMNLAGILTELSLIRAYRGSNVLSLDDPELFRHPVAYMSEPGGWRPTDREAAALRAYLLKGGFIIFDDFRGRDWYAFEEGLKKALPEAEIVRLDGSEAIFSTFFEIESLEGILPPYNGLSTEWWGVFEDNDRSRRLLAIANFNNDLGDYWEYSGQGFYPIDMTNEAYKLGVNYIIYAMTR